MTISQFQQDLGLGLKDEAGKPVLTTVWGYNGQYPGPTLLAKKGQPVLVKWLNRLVDAHGAPLPHLLPIDKTIDWAAPSTPGIPIVTHLHGGHTESASDGLSQAWYTPFGRSKGPAYRKGEQTPYFYDNSQEAATLWYHDHAQGITRLNVYAGLAGFYLLTDNVEQGLQKSNKLPASPYDIGLAIQDRMFTTDGQLFYPSEPEEPDQPAPSILPEFFGDIMLVNGKAWPLLKVEPRQYRFRLLNGSDSRFYNLQLTRGLKMWQIGSDNGLLPQPVEQGQLLLAPAERKDVIIDFSAAELQGKTIILTNNAAIPFPNGDPVEADDALAQIMAFKVCVPLNPAYPRTPVPATLRAPLPSLPAATNVRKLILYEAEDEYGRLKPMLGTMDGGVFMFEDPITENPAMNSTEIWEIYNLTEDAHPIHLHLVSFRVLSSQEFTGTINPENGALSQVQLQGPLKRPESGQDGRKDTYPIRPGEVTRLVATFDRPGLYVWHCHILSHEDHDMMRSFYVGAMPGAPQVGNPAQPGPGRNVAFSFFPNPFSTSATLHLSVSEPASVAVRLFALGGRLVREVPARQLPAGQHQLELNGAGLDNGLYVCELKVNDQLYHSRLVLAR
ncbi:multicopper oxidase domain-containing protein [Hymenobacter sp. DG25B]|uniref:multicopper oxidase domain-containing protein n=1 Tax=Hymenobacter sp. DG25B TaxID=1385664 RepID=UPI001E3DA575|nr:multicopper oxidase domain-containing protein [Hymenobacter sp. DG25B]